MSVRVAMAKKATVELNEVWSSKNIRIPKSKASKGTGVECGVICMRDPDTQKDRNETA